MFCPICGIKVEEGEKYCPACGTDLSEINGSAPASEANENTDAPEVNETPEAAVAEEVDAPVAETEIPYAAEPVYAAKAAGKGGKRGKSLFVKLGIAAVAVALAVIVVFNFGAIKGFFVKTFSSNENYFAHVEKKAVKETADDFTRAYGRYLSFADGDSRSEATARLKINPETLDELSTLIAGSGIDIDWLDDVGIKMVTNIKNGAIEIELGLGVAGEEIITISVVTDDDSIYVGFPNLGDGYMRGDVSMSGVGTSSLSELLSKGALSSALPSEEVLNKVINKYVDVVLGCIEDVEEDSDEIEVDDISQKVTVLEVEFDEKLVAEIAVAVLEEVVDDKDIEDIIIDFVSYYEEMGAGVDADEVYDEFIMTVEEALDSYDPDDIGREELFTLFTYVDSAHEVIGHAVEVDGEEVFKYVTVTKGKEFEREISFPGFSIIGEGKKNGEKEDAEYKIAVEGETVCRIEVIDLDTKAMEEGILNGKFVIRPESEIISELFDYSVGAVIESLDLGLYLEFTGNEKSSGVTIGVMGEDELLVGLVMEGTTSDGKTVKVPSSSDIYEEYEAEEWLATLDLGKITRAVVKAGLPDEIVEAIESVIYQLEP